MKDVGIYGIFNIINRHVYIGSSKKLIRRFSKHKYQLRKNIHCNSHLQKSWNKYGESNFEFKIIENCDNDDDVLTAKEQYWIDHYGSSDRSRGYNIQGAGLRAKMSDETKIKLSILNTGKKKSPETKTKISIACKGRKRSKESIEKSASGLRGQKRSAETKRKQSELKKGIPLSEEHKNNISISLIGNKNNLGKKYPGRTLSDKQKEEISKSKMGNKYWLGRKHSEESKRKISEAKKGTKLPEETKQKISDALMGRVSGMFGKKHSEETKKKMSNSMKGRTFTEEHRRNMSIAGKKRIFTEEHRRHLSEAGKRMWEKIKNNLNTEKTSFHSTMP